MPQDQWCHIKILAELNKSQNKYAFRFVPYNKCTVLRYIYAIMPIIDISGER